MIRELRKVDINKVTEIWLDTNIKTHYFISTEYWKSNFELVKELLLQATVYVYEDKQEIQGFIGLVTNTLKVFLFLPKCNLKV